jgi:solute carrier family 41
MKQIDELIMIIPVILNLKGNLEMNLSSRLGTAANVGHLDESKSRRKIILGNLALLQVQATVVSFVAATVSLLLGLIVPNVQNSSKIATPANSTTIVFARTDISTSLEVLMHHASRKLRPAPPSFENKSGLAE